VGERERPDDVSGREQLAGDPRAREAQLVQMQRIEAIGRLAGGVAHDFNNLLNVIFGYCDMLTRELAGQERALERVGHIQRAAERGAALTRQLLAYSRQQVVQPRVLDLNALVAETSEMLRRLIGEDLRLVLRQAPGLGRVSADPGQLEQVLMNLAVNARDAMPVGGTLTIETENAELGNDFVRAHPWMAAGRYVQLSISDTGVGMDGATRERAFEPFFTTKGEGKGTGLGLSMVYGIVKQAGGSILLYSEPGIGSTFKIYLPRVDAEASSAPLSCVGLPLGGSETILLVEDQELALEMLREALQGYGYDVLAAANGAAALQLAAAASGPIQLLLTDVVMPGMSGRELAEALLPAHPGMRVLYMSGYTSDAITLRGVLEEGVAFISKPFSPEALVRRLREVLAAP
jgi:nitrogen-specific signal transduction histidine kinase/CheY-like chemotaxis protein